VLAVLGLGNPGEEYRGTRHNVGFRVLARLAAELGAPGARKRLRSLIAEVPLGKEKLLLAWPQTFMNESGRSARAVLDFYGLEPARLLVVCDDFHLPLGRLRARSDGSAGGHHGLESIIRELGTGEFPRLRLGIGECSGDSVAYVLGRFSRAEQAALEPAVARAALAVRVWVEKGMEACMNQFNAGTAEPKGPAQSEGAT